MSKQRAPIERLIDLSVAVPRSLLRASRLSARAIVRHARPRAAVPDRAPQPATDAPAASTSSQRAPAAASNLSVDELPIDGYDDLAARQVVDRLSTLAPDDLALIEAYERTHRNRSTVLGMIARLSA